MVIRDPDRYHRDGELAKAEPEAEQPSEVISIVDALRRSIKSESGPTRKP